MLDRLTTTLGRTRRAGLALACGVACAAAPAAADPAKQELAGPSRPAQLVLVPRDAIADSLAPAMEADPAILFAPGSAQLTPRATRVLDRLGRALMAPEVAADRFRVEGHADGWGPADTARDLARRRAQAVADYLEQNCAIAAARLDVGASAGRPARQVRVIALQP